MGIPFAILPTGTINSGKPSSPAINKVGLSTIAPFAAAGVPPATSLAIKPASSATDTPVPIPGNKLAIPDPNSNIPPR